MMFMEALVCCGWFLAAGCCSLTDRIIGAREDGMALTKDELIAWALSNGFQADYPDGLIAPLGGGLVRIEFLKRNVRVGLEAGEHKERLATVALSSPLLKFDEHGVPAGMGLGMSFMMRLGRRGPVPPWFPPFYVEMLGKMRSESADPETLSPPAM